MYMWAALSTQQAYLSFLCCITCKLLAQLRDLVLKLVGRPGAKTSDTIQQPSGQQRKTALSSTHTRVYQFDALESAWEDCGLPKTAALDRRQPDPDTTAMKLQQQRNSAQLLLHCQKLHLPHYCFIALALPPSHSQLRNLVPELVLSAGHAKRSRPGSRSPTIVQDSSIVHKAAWRT